MRSCRCVCRRSLDSVRSLSTVADSRALCSSFIFSRCLAWNETRLYSPRTRRIVVSVTEANPRQFSVLLVEHRLQLLHSFLHRTLALLLLKNKVSCMTSYCKTPIVGNVLRPWTRLAVVAALRLRPTEAVRPAWPASGQPVRASRAGAPASLQSASIAIMITKG